MQLSKSIKSLLGFGILISPTIIGIGAAQTVNLQVQSSYNLVEADQKTSHIALYTHSHRATTARQPSRPPSSQNYR